MSVTIQFRGGTAAAWAAADPVTPFARELCVETDTDKAKFGDGVTTYANLPYWTLGALDVQSVFGRTGPITAQSGDYTPSQVGALPIAGGAMTGWLSPHEVTVNPLGGSFTLDARAGNSFVLPLTASGNTVNTPANPSPGQQIVLAPVQDPTGSRTLAWASGWNFGLSGPPALSTTPGAVDFLAFRYSASLSQFCYVSSALGFSPPAQTIAFVDSVGSTFNQGVGNGVSLVLPGDLAIGDAVILGTVSIGASNVVPAGFTVTTTGTSQPVALSPLFTGIFGTGSALYGFYVQAGDISVANGGSAGSNATLTVTATGLATGYTTSASLAAWSGAVLPPGAIARSTSVSGSNTYVAPTTTTVANGGWEVAVVMTGNGLTTTFPGSLTPRTSAQFAVCIADNNAPLAAGTVIGGETWGSNAGSVEFYAYTIALDAA